MPGYHLPPFAAADAGLFEQYGLQLEILEPAHGPHNVTRVAEGGADFCLTSIAHYLHAWQVQPGVKARFVFAVAQRGHMAAFVMEGRPTAAGIVPESARDLEGARIAGTPDSPFVKEYTAFARETLGFEHVPVTGIPYGDALKSLGSGDYDVFADYLDLFPRIQHYNPGVPLRAFHFADEGLQDYGSGLVTSDRMIQERPETILRMIDATRAMYENSRAHPEAGLESLMRAFPETNPTIALGGWQQTQKLVFGWEAARFGPGWIEPEIFENTIRYKARVLGFPQPPVEATYDARFVRERVPA